MSIPTKARDLKPGNVVTDFDGIRMYAAFDTKIAAEDGSVIVFIAAADQHRFGKHIYLDPEDIVMVRETVAPTFHVARATDGTYRVMYGATLISNHGRRKVEAQTKADRLAALEAKDNAAEEEFSETLF